MTSSLLAVNKFVAKLLSNVSNVNISDMSPDTIMGIIAVATEMAENWNGGKLKGAHKKELVISAMRIIVDTIPMDEFSKDTALDFIDSQGNEIIELIIWLSRNEHIVKNINKIKKHCCMPMMSLCKRPLRSSRVSSLPSKGT